MSARTATGEFPLGPPRRRALLGLLLIRLGKTVPAGQLIEELWGARPPRHSKASLQSYVSHLRNALAAGLPGEDPARLVRYHASGYVLDVDPRQVDACRFEWLVGEGRRLRSADDSPQARARLTEALDLWQGPPFTDLADYGPLAEESARLEQLRLAAVEARADACLDMGEPEAAVADLQREAGTYPLRERLVGQLMTALYRLGRQAEALHVYERTRASLDEELGITIGGQLQSLHAAILSGHMAPLPAAVPEPRSHRRPQGPPGPPPPAAPGPAAEPPSGAADAGAAGSSGPPPGGEHALLGREKELSALCALVEDTAGGQGRLTVVMGEAGIGKTRLLMELDRRPDGTGPYVVWGHCLPGPMPPNWLWAQVLRQLAAAFPDTFEAAAAPFRQPLSPLMPELLVTGDTGAGQDAPWAQERFRTYDAVCEVLLAVAVKHPLTLLLEDLHWADAPSLDLLRLLAIRHPRRSLGIVVTARDADIEVSPLLQRTLGEVLRNPRTTTVRLTGLSEETVGTLVRNEAGVAVGSALVRTLYERSKGNPYFVTQLLSLLGDAEDLHEPQATRLLQARVPAGVREVLRQRFATLPAESLRLLQACAVLGTEVDTGLVDVALGPELPVPAAMDAVVRAQLLREDPRRPGRAYFTHALVQETLYDELPSRERARLHATMARTLTGGGAGRPDAERTAHHAWRAGSELPPPDVLPLLLEAAEQAEHRLAYEQAETWLRRALALSEKLPVDAPSLPDIGRRLHVHLGQILATTRGYGDAEAERALNRSRELNAVTGTADHPSVLWALCTAHLVTGRYDESLEFSTRLRRLAAIGQDPVAVLGASYGTGVVLHVQGRLGQALEELERGVALADRLFPLGGPQLATIFQHDPRVSCRSYNALTHWLLGDRQAATRRRQELLALTGAGSRPSDQTFALYVDAVLAALEGDAEGAERSSVRGAEVAARYGLRYWQAMLEVCQGWAVTHLGDAEDGIARLTSAIERLRSSRTLLRLPLHLGFMAEAQHLAGLDGAARATLEELLTEVHRRGEQVYLDARLPAGRLCAELLGSGGPLDAVPSAHRVSVQRHERGVGAGRVAPVSSRRCGR